VPPELRSRIAKPVPITVKLYVDRSGSVEYAELLSNGTGDNRDLASLAVFTARRWRFSPAQEGGEAVPSQVRVQFRFGADAAR
jgi:TonB family protein